MKGAAGSARQRLEGMQRKHLHITHPCAIAWCEGSAAAEKTDLLRKVLTVKMATVLTARLAI